MECLQYRVKITRKKSGRECFKPCYKWNAFNTMDNYFRRNYSFSFKPCYNWTAFNTEKEGYIVNVFFLF